jgi:hypothetical protein
MLPSKMILVFVGLAARLDLGRPAQSVASRYGRSTIRSRNDIFVLFRCNTTMVELSLWWK